jgi:Protein of unknown function (DUF1565)
VAKLLSAKLSLKRTLHLAAVLMILTVLLSLATPGRVAEATAFYVATYGNDTNPGTIARPWRTVQRAANLATPGSTVHIRAGIYKERVTVNVSGSSSAGFITFRNYPNEAAVMDGTGLTVPATETGMFLLKDRSYIVVKGLEIRNYRTSVSNRVPVGIHIRGTSHHLQVRNNKIHHIQHNGTSANGTDAHGIAVYGTSPQRVHP